MTSEDEINADKEFFNEFRDSISVDPFDDDIEEEKKTSSGMAVAVWLGILIGIVIAAVVAWDIVDPKMFIHDKTSEIPLIRRDAKQVKVRPSDPGGMEIPNRDKLVYRRMSSVKSDEKVERLLPAPERPKQPSVSDEPVENYDEIKADVAESILAPESVDVTKDETVKVVKVTEPEAIVRVKKDEPKPVKKTVKKTVKKKVVEKKPPPVKAPDVKLEEAWQVQIVALRSSKAAEKAWKKVKVKFPKLLGKQSYNVVRVDLGAKGIYYRLRVGEFPNRGKAMELCSALKKRKQGCIIVQR